MPLLSGPSMLTFRPLCDHPNPAAVLLIDASRPQLNADASDPSGVRSDGARVGFITHDHQMDAIEIMVVHRSQKCLGHLALLFLLAVCNGQRATHGKRGD